MICKTQVCYIVRLIVMKEIAMKKKPIFLSKQEASTSTSATISSSNEIEVEAEVDVPEPSESTKLLQMIANLDAEDDIDFTYYQMGLYGNSTDVEKTLSVHVQHVLQTIRDVTLPPKQRGRPRKKPVPPTQNTETRKPSKYQTFIKKMFKKTYECNKHLTTQEVMLVLSSLWNRLKN